MYLSVTLTKANRHCCNKGCFHKSNSVYLVADLESGTYYQKCFDQICKSQNFRSQASPLPAELVLEARTTSTSILATMNAAISPSGTISICSTPIRGRCVQSFRGCVLASYPNPWGDAAKPRRSFATAAAPGSRSGLRMASANTGSLSERVGSRWGFGFESGRRLVRVIHWQRSICRSRLPSSGVVGSATGGSQGAGGPRQLPSRTHDANAMLGVPSRRRGRPQR